MERAKDFTPVMTRLPEALRLWLKHQAVDNRRSLNSELVVRLEESRRREEQAQQEPRG